MSATDFLRSVGEKLLKVEQELFDVVQKEKEAFEESTAEEFDAEFVRRLWKDAEFQRQLKVIAQQYCDIELSVKRFFRCSESELCWSAWSGVPLRHFGLWRALLGVEVGAGDSTEEVEGSLLLDNLTSSFCDRCCLDSQQLSN